MVTSVQSLHPHGLALGGGHRHLELAGVDDKEVVGRVALPEHHLPLAILPALLDAVHHRLEHLHHIGEIYREI